MDMAQFLGFSTDVGFVNNGGDNPITVSRGASGSDISFNLIFEGTPLPQAQQLMG